MNLVRPDSDLCRYVNQHAFDSRKIVDSIGTHDVSVDFHENEHGSWLIILNT
jgi:hypothetical protein